MGKDACMTYDQDGNYDDSKGGEREGARCAAVSNGENLKTYIKHFLHSPSWQGSILEFVQLRIVTNKLFKY